MLKSAVSYFSVCTAFAAVWVTFMPCSVFTVFVPSLFVTVLPPQAVRQSASRAEIAAESIFLLSKFISFTPLFVTVGIVKFVAIVFIIFGVALGHNFRNR